MTRPATAGERGRMAATAGERGRFVATAGDPGRIAATAGDRERIAVCLATEAFHPVYAGPAVRFTRYLPGLHARGVDVRVFTCTPTPVKAAMSEVAAGGNGGPAPTDGPPAAGSVPGRGWATRRNGELLPVERVRDVPVHRVRVPDRGGFRRSAWFGWTLADFCRRPELRPAVVQSLSLGSASVPSLLRLRRMGVPVVFTTTMVAPLPENPLKRGILRQQTVRTFRLLTRVVVSSGVMRDALLDTGVTTPIEVIPNGVDTRRFRPAATPEERERVRSRLGIGRDDPVVLFAGPVSPRKGVDLLLEAWGFLAARHPRLHLVIVGPRRDAADPAHAGFHEKLCGLVTASGAAERVHFTGLVEDVETYMRAADLFAFTSRREGMPNVVPEAMAAGLPVVTTPFVGLPAEFGTAGRHYVLAEFDAADLAERIDSLLREPDRVRALGRAARGWVEERLAVEASLDRYAALYREVGRMAMAYEERGTVR